MSDQFVGEVRVFGGNYAPQGWVLCDGGLLPISQYSTLYAVIGTAYGGDGQTTFGVPDLRGRIPVHQGPGYQMGQTGGVEQVTLITAQLPQHDHVMQASTGTGSSASPTGNLWAQIPAKLYTTQAPNAVMDTSAIAQTGLGQAHENMPPFLSINFIIAVEGLYPARP
jgi:microcystin-dependent protein